MSPEQHPKLSPFVCIPLECVRHTSHTGNWKTDKHRTVDRTDELADGLHVAVDETLQCNIRQKYNKKYGIMEMRTFQGLISTVGGSHP